MKHEKCGTPECCRQCDPVITKIRQYWPAAKAAIVEALYLGGMETAKVSTGYIRYRFPELNNTSFWRYSDRIVSFLFQPDLFPETLSSRWKRPTWNENSVGETIYEQVS